MLSYRINHANITEERAGKGWAVSIKANGHNQFFAVFRKKQDAQTFADNERRKLGLKSPLPSLSER